MKRVFLTLVVVFGILPLTVASAVRSSLSLADNPADPTPSPTTAAPESIIQQVEQAIQESIQEHQEFVLGLLVNQPEIEELAFSPDLTWATGTLVLKDPETGDVLPTEPGLVIAWLEETGWQVALPSDTRWAEMVRKAPADLLPAKTKQAWLDTQAEAQAASVTGPFGGYLLPWEAGKTAWLSQSVAHDKYITSGSAHYAFDFYIPQTMFDIYASKGGAVWLAKWDVPNGVKTGTGNYIVLQDTTTDPTTYQLYLHLAFDSIPVELRTKGANVMQGQFIGVADDTGQSTGHHLHFQVHTNPNSYWGTSVDITFDDVAINGGRPRVDGKYYSDKPYCRPDDVCEEFQSAYVSGNAPRYDKVPPTGGLQQPSNGDTIKEKNLVIEGWAYDAHSGIKEVLLIAKYNGTWNSLGLYTTTTFSNNWDMCAAGVPDGPVSLALQIWDKAGNTSIGMPGLTHFTKQYDCSPPPPLCTPASNQVAVFAQPDYQGACTVLGVGDHANIPALSGMGGARVHSILTGSSVLATLYTETNYTGRSETIIANDSNLSDNLVGTDSAISARVRLKSTAPDAPSTLVSPPSQATFQEGSSINLAWRAPAGGREFQVELQNDGNSNLSPWLDEPVWNLNQLQLTPGDYSWRVRARNDAGESSWSTAYSFTILSNGGNSLSPVAAPYSDAMDSGSNSWASTGLWNLVQDPARSYSPPNAWYYGTFASNPQGSYATSGPNSGDLTSRPIILPGSSTSYLLRFRYRYQTEGPGRHWDRRRVQISRDGGPFENVLQLHDDLPDTWLAASVDLSDYAGATIQVRFHFDTIDNLLNQFQGWTIDDFEILAEALPGCGDANQSPASAVSLAYGQSIQALICPAGDVDYYAFDGVAGDRIWAVAAPTSGQPPVDLELALTLLDADGQSVLAQSPGESWAGTGTRLGYRLTRTGKYYLKVRLKSHPSGGGSEYSYAIQLARDDQAPLAAFSNPRDGAYIPDNPVNLTIVASDDLASPSSTSQGYATSGVSHVEFWWHPSDWWDGDWILLGTDRNGQDGWTWEFDQGQVGNQAEMAFYAKVYDFAGNWSAAGAWNLMNYPGRVYLPVINR